MQYRHLVETAQKYARQSGFKMEAFSDIRDTNNSNSDVVVCAYEHAPSVSLYKSLNFHWFLYSFVIYSVGEFASKPCQKSASCRNILE